MCLQCSRSSPQNADPVPRPAPFLAVAQSEPIAPPSEHETSPGLAAQLRASLDETPTASLTGGRTFDAIQTESVVLSIEQLLDAMEIIHGTFHEADTLQDTRKCLGALEPVIAMTVAKTAKLRATLFPGGPRHVDN